MLELTLLMTAILVVLVSDALCAYVRIETERRRLTRQGARERRGRAMRESEVTP